jgi:putative CocE/NonD family hydrolase
MQVGKGLGMLVEHADESAGTAVQSSNKSPVSATSLLERAWDEPPIIERMPAPEHHLLLPMRDGIRLETSVWLPTAGGPWPAILMRTPYKESVLGFRRLGVLGYVEAGYALVIQLIRGIGASDGRFTFNSPQEGPDGFDTVEWIASQDWCDGNVGMDGSSYAAMMQLRAASTRPPHLRCIVPAAPCLDFFREIPYMGGCISRLHTINWVHLLQIESLSEQKGGFMGTLPVLCQPDVMQRMTKRPLVDAAEDELTGDFLQHYRDVLEHPTLDDWWQTRTLGAEDFARMDLPVLVVTGNFDFSVGALKLWRNLEQEAPPGPRHLLIGPWDHGQCYAGGDVRHGPYDLGESASLDLPRLRLAFFDLHLKGRDSAPVLDSRATVFITGANTWKSFDCFPPPRVNRVPWHLASDGRANSAWGDGRLVPDAPTGHQPADRFIDDPDWPFVAPLAAAKEPQFRYDATERERDHATLVYGSDPLPAPMTILGEPEAELFVASDAVDADVFVFLVEHRADGRSIVLSRGQLRLRYRGGFDRELPLTPDEPVGVCIPMLYVAHELPRGSRLRLLVSGSDFPLIDPNPHVPGPISQATETRRALQTVFHDAERPSRLWLPLLPALAATLKQTGAVQNVPG